VNSKDKVLILYPHASVEHESTGEWSVWYISLDRKKWLNERYWPERFSRRLLGLGRTEDEAWANAAREI
jgi:hypothetical protein